jgi:hypothetical protein
MFPKGKNQKAIDAARLHMNTYMLDSVRLSSMLETYAPTTSEWAGIACTGNDARGGPVFGNNALAKGDLYIQYRGNRWLTYAQTSKRL